MKRQIVVAGSCGFARGMISAAAGLGADTKNAIALDAGTKEQFAALLQDSSTETVFLIDSLLSSAYSALMEALEGAALSANVLAVSGINADCTVCALQMLQEFDTLSELGSALRSQAQQSVYFSVIEKEVSA